MFSMAELRSIFFKDSSWGLTTGSLKCFAFNSRCFKESPMEDVVGWISLFFSHLLISRPLRVLSETHAWSSLFSMFSFFTFSLKFEKCCKITLPLYQASCVTTALNRGKKLFAKLFILVDYLLLTLRNCSIIISVFVNDFLSTYFAGHLRLGFGFDLFRSKSFGFTWLFVVDD